MISGAAVQPHIYTVTELNERVNATLAEQIGPVLVEGEVSDVRLSRDTWLTFTLKDATSTVSCFAHKRRVGTNIADGMQLKVLGTPRLYVPYGKYSLNLMAAEPVGEGALRQAYELLLKALDTEGLLAAERKRPLPRFPEHIGLITSPDGAALADVRRVLTDRWGTFRLTLFPVAVQGMAAVNEIIEALRYCNEQPTVDVIIMTRGGGSLEDLQAFNDERVARAIASSRIPVVAAIGHERDITIAELVADQRAATPSNAAQLTVPDRETIQLELNAARLELTTSLDTRLRTNADTLSRFYTAAHHSVFRVGHHLALYREKLWTNAENQRLVIGKSRDQIARLQATLEERCEQHITKMRQTAQLHVQILASLNPKAILRRGYSYTVDDHSGTILTSSSQVTARQRIRTHLADGAFTSEVLNEKS